MGRGTGQAPSYLFPPSPHFLDCLFVMHDILLYTTCSMGMADDFITYLARRRERHGLARLVLFGMNISNSIKLGIGHFPFLIWLLSCGQKLETENRNVRS